MTPDIGFAGIGDVRVADCLRLLLDDGFTGTWSIEPHVAFRPDAATAGGDRYAGFVACGRALERLVSERVLPAAEGWRAVPGGIAFDRQEVGHAQ